MSDEVESAQPPMDEPPPGAAPRVPRAGAGRPVLLPPIERIIPWRHRIKTKFLFVTVAIGAVGVSILAVAEQRMQDHLLDAEAAGASLFSDTIQHATHRAMLENRLGDAFEVMRDIQRQEGVEAVRLLAKDGHVAFSTMEGEQGKVLDVTAEPCLGCHTQGRPKAHVSLPERMRVFQHDGKRSMGFITPVRNEPTCYTAACHAHRPDEDVLGVIDVNLSLGAMDARVESFRRGSLVMTAVGVLLLAAFFFVFARRNVVRPVQAMLDATRRVAADQLDAEIVVRSKGEMGLLAASFNDMTRALRRMDGELRGLMQGLEKQVEQRTAALAQAQTALVQSEKLSSLGRLSASIAHEINNPLAGILTFSKLIIRRLDAGPPDDAARAEIVRHMGLVQRETERCSAIVRSLLDFARDRPLALRELDVNQAVEEALQLLAHQLQLQGQKLEKRLGALPPVKADFGQLRQAIVNLGINAIEAMGKGGTLTVITRAVSGGGVEILVSDTGPGISQVHLARVFEPFFTTKEKGTGLGLAVVYGIMQAHHGRVEVHSEPGRGTSFSLRLPPIDAVPPPAEAPPGGAPFQPGRGPGRGTDTERGR